MYFSRIMFNPHVDHQQLARTLCNNSYREHQMLWQLFDSDPDAKRDFLYRQVIEHGRVKYYVLSRRMPIDKTGIWCIDPPKVYNPRLSEGQKLSFMLRANPVITVATVDGKKQRHDVVMQEKKRIGYKQIPEKERQPLQQLVQQSSMKWLTARMGINGFSLEPQQVIADGYQQYRSSINKQQHLIRYSTVDFQGILTVTDIDLFRKALFSGIGKSKAFGCGLLLIKRISN